MFYSVDWIILTPIKLRSGLIGQPSHSKHSKSNKKSLRVLVVNLNNVPDNSFYRCLEERIDRFSQSVHVGKINMKNKLKIYVRLFRVTEVHAKAQKRTLSPPVSPSLNSSSSPFYFGRQSNEFPQCRCGTVDEANSWSVSLYLLFLGIFAWRLPSKRRF